LTPVVGGANNKPFSILIGSTWFGTAYDFQNKDASNTGRTVWRDAESFLARFSSGID
jgi:hypothetical protein